MLNLTKTTPDRRFTVRIESHVDDGALSLYDTVVSLRELTEVLMGGAEAAAALARQLVTEAANLPRTSAAVDPSEVSNTGTPSTRVE